MRLVIKLIMHLSGNHVIRTYVRNKFIMWGTTSFVPTFDILGTTSFVPTFDIIWGTTSFVPTFDILLGNHVIRTYVRDHGPVYPSMKKMHC